MSEFFEYFTFIAKLTIGSFYCFGVFKVFDDKDLLLRVRAWLDLRIGKWTKPLVSCPPCMASVHGSYLGIYFFGYDWIVIVYCLALCGLNYIINTLLPEYE